jgi:hypothetical protein
MKNNKQQTAVDVAELALKLYPFSGDSVRNAFITGYNKAKEMEKEQSQAYAAFCVACDRKKLPLLEFEGWIKLEGGNK